MVQKLNSMPQYRRKMQKHDHDISQSFALTLSTGMLLPVYFDMAHAGDDYFFNSNFTVRYNPLLKPFIGDVDIHVDHFFVPLSMLYTPTSSIFYQTDDILSSATPKASLVKDHFPLYDIDNSLAAIRDRGLALPQTFNDGSSVISYNTASFDCIGKSVVRLCDMFQYNIEPLFMSEGAQTANPHTTPWFLSAYQAINELHYRNDDRQVKSYDWQLDQYYSTSGTFDSQSLLRLNYVSAYKDFFNAVKVSPIGSSISMLNGSDSWDYLSKVNSYLFDGTYGRAEYDGNYSGLVDSSVTSTHGIGNVGSGSVVLNRAFNAANIRQLFMVDSLLRITGRANKDYESQFLAHYGIEIPHDVMHSITHIGHDVATMGTNVVQSQSDTYDSGSGTGAPLGDLGGQGMCRLTGKKRKFHAPFHGVVMSIMYAVPRFRYFGGISPLHNLSSPDKFWQPEYDKRGMEPLFAYYANREVPSLPNRRIGWIYGFEQFKRKYDRISAAFKNITFPSTTTVNEYSPWVLSRNPWRDPVTNQPINGTAESTPTEAGTLLNFTDLLSTPHDLDNVMMVKYNSSWIESLTIANYHQLFYTDPLICDFRMNCKKVNGMSEYSEPEITD